MKRDIFIILTGITMLLVMTGCPYESSVPLSNSCTSVVDPSLVGTFVYHSMSGNKDIIEIMKFNDHEYFVETHEKDKNGNSVTNRGRGFITIIEGQKFLNYCDLLDPDKFIFFKYEIRDNLLLTVSPSDKFVKQKFTSGQELSDYFKKNMNNEGFYEPADTAIRSR